MRFTRSRRRRSVIIMIVALAMMMLQAVPALGAPPANDTFDERTVIGAVPFQETLDTSEATTDAFDADAGAQCVGPPATDAAVWYEITLDEDGMVLVDLGGTDYTAGVLVFSGDPIMLEDCSPFGVEFFAAAGVPHYLMIIDDQGDEDDPENPVTFGGTLQVSVDVLPPLEDEVCPGVFADDPEVAGLNHIIGTDGDDVLVGTKGADFIVGGEGNDTIHGGGGDDVIAGCAGDDYIDAGPGNDMVTGDDLAFFGQPGSTDGGDDTVFGGPGNDDMLGGPGDDVMHGGNGNDGVIGNQGDDWLDGEEGDDFVAGGFGEDYVSGGNGSDFVSGGFGSDMLFGGNGKDFLNGAAPAFGPGEEPDVDSVDTCDGGNAKDDAINCEA